MIRPELDRRVLAFFSAGLWIKHLLDITGFERRYFPVITIYHHMKIFGVGREFTVRF